MKLKLEKLRKECDKTKSYKYFCGRERMNIKRIITNIEVDRGNIKSYANVYVILYLKFLSR